MPLYKSDLSQLLLTVSKVLTANNYLAYIVGGFIRDWILGRMTEDIDLAVQGDSLDIVKKIAGIIDGRYVLLDETNKVGRIVVVRNEQLWHLDFTMFSGAIRDDLARRDFTMNAMAVDLNEFVSGSFLILDPFSGETDLKNGLIKAVSSHIYKDDASRLLRAVRLAAELGFKIESGTEKLIKQDSCLVAQVPGEKLREELLRLLSLPDFSNLLIYLDKLSLLTEIIPEVGEMKEVEQPPEHYWDVFNHSVQTVATVEFLLGESKWFYGSKDLLGVIPWPEDINHHFNEEISNGSCRRNMLKLAALLHDVAKPHTKAIDSFGRMRFIGHPKLGAAISNEIMSRLRFSGREIKLVERLVYYHLRPAQMATIGLPSSRAIYRYFRDTEDDGVDILLLAMADYLATSGPELNLESWEQHNQLISYILNEHYNQQAKVSPARLVNGHALMSFFNLTPGPLVGKLLDLVNEAQATGEITTREEANDLVHRELQKECFSGY